MAAGQSCAWRAAARTLAGHWPWWVAPRGWVWGPGQHAAAVGCAVPVHGPAVHMCLQLLQAPNEPHVLRAAEPHGEQGCGLPPTWPSDLLPGSSAAPAAAALQVYSRALQLQLGPTSALALAPLVDLCNHSAAPSAQWAVARRSAGGASLVGGSSWSSGEWELQVCACRGGGCRCVRWGVGCAGRCRQGTAAARGGTRGACGPGQHFQ